MNRLELLEFTRTVEGLLPWEPVINSKISRNFFTYDLEPEEEDCCLECNTKDFKLGIIVTDNAGNCFCSWECLVKRAKKFPNYYTIHDEGLYNNS